MIQNEEYDRLKQLAPHDDDAAERLLTLAFRRQDIPVAAEVGIRVAEARRDVPLLLRLWDLSWQHMPELQPECARVVSLWLHDEELYEKLAPRIPIKALPDTVGDPEAVVTRLHAQRRDRMITWAYSTLLDSNHPERLLSACRLVLRNPNGRTFWERHWPRRMRLPEDPPDFRPVPAHLNLRPNLALLACGVALSDGDEEEAVQHAFRLAGAVERPEGTAEITEGHLRYLLRVHTGLFPREGGIQGNRVGLNPRHFVLPTLPPLTAQGMLDLYGFTRLAFPIMRRVFPSLLANEIVSVQPMTSPQGALFYLDHIYNQEQSGPRYATEHINGEPIATGDGVRYGPTTEPLEETLAWTPVLRPPADPGAEGHEVVGTRIAVLDQNGDIVQEVRFDRDGHHQGTAFSGHFDYESGDITGLRFTEAPADGDVIRAHYQYDSEVIEQEISRRVVFGPRNLETPNANGRIYPRRVLDRAVASFRGARQRLTEQFFETFPALNEFRSGVGVSSRGMGPAQTPQRIDSLDEFRDAFGVEVERPTSGSMADLDMRSAAQDSRMRDHVLDTLLQNQIDYLRQNDPDRDNDE